MPRLEDDTPLLSDVVADTVVMEVETYTGAELVNRDSYVRALVKRQADTYAVNPDWRRKMKRRDGREILYSFMRHWLSGELKDRAPSVYRLIEHTPFSNGIRV
jgi:hypothetical protein